MAILKSDKSALMLLVITALVSGCSPSMPKAYDPTEEPEVYTIAGRQLPPEDVYNRLRWVNHPEVVPSRQARVSQNRLNPVFSLELKNVSLEQAAISLAATARYRSYTVSSVSSRKLTISRLGTIDELAEAIAREAGIRVVVDHENREVRFLSQAPVTSQIDEGFSTAE